MPDNLSPEDRKKTMRAVKGSDTSLERVVFAAFAERGWECDRNVGDLPGKPDFVFAAQRLAVFVDGDFWHGWRFPLWCEKLTPYWRWKIERNRRRDRLNFRRLRRRGWRVLRLWGHQVEKDLAAAVGRVAALLAAGPGLNPAAACANPPPRPPAPRPQGGANGTADPNGRRPARPVAAARRRRGG
jgi:DNA mismatch endonuclease (patch repair protein)